MEWLWIKSRAITNNINYEKELKKPNDILATKERKMHFIKNTYLPQEKMLEEIMLGEKGLKRPVTVSTLGKLGA